jgi:hypothetical protein
MEKNGFSNIAHAQNQLVYRIIYIFFLHKLLSKSSLKQIDLQKWSLSLHNNSPFIFSTHFFFFLFFQFLLFNGALELFLFLKHFTLDGWRRIKLKICVGQ